MNALFALTAGLLLAADDKKDLDKLQGTWETVAAEQNGEKVTGEELKKVMIKLIITGNKFEYRVGEDFALKGMFTIDETKKLKTIDSKGTDSAGKESKSVGIYELKDDTLRVCLVEMGERPTEFVTKKDSPNILLEYKRVKP